MRKSDVPELHYITPLANLASILQFGILSNRAVRSLSHASIAKVEVQNIRSRKQVPGGKRLHEYVNLYLCARNPMLFLRCQGDAHRDICVLGVSTQVFELGGAIVTDMNAARNLAAFRAVDEGLERLAYDEVYAEYWTDPDPFEHDRKKGIKCAEVLVPQPVPPTLIDRILVSCRETRTSRQLTDCGRPVIIDEHLFFLRSGGYR